MSALERRKSAGKPLVSVASVANFFPSWIDTLVDEQLRKGIAGGMAQSRAPAREVCDR